MDLLAEIGITIAFEALEELRTRLDADSVSAVFPTRYGPTTLETSALGQAVIHNGTRLDLKDPA